jgi:thioester reductase-like protein
MYSARAILLTGATGLLGRFLLRDLLVSGHDVAVLVRPARKAMAAERVAELVAFWSEWLGQQLPRPVVLEGELKTPGMGLSAGDRRWLARQGAAVIHSAAQVALRRSDDGEPWQTNVEGTRHLLDLCQSAGVSAFHHLSTAFVCGVRSGTVYEDELECGQRFHNDYERSKFEAERLVRQAPGVRATIYRPSVIVGDSQTGYTSSYHGIYRFLEMPARWAALQASDRNHSARRLLPLRVPLTGEETRNLVPVDWVAQAIVRLAHRPARHGRTYHLVARQSVPICVIKEVAEELLGIDGVGWAGRAASGAPTALEQVFLDYLRDYWGYFAGDPIFDCQHTSAVLPELPPPCIDRLLLERLIRFAVTDQWGRSRSTRRGGGRATPDCGAYIERFFPAHARRSVLAQAVALDLTVACDIRGAGGGQWSCKWVRGELVDVSDGLDNQAAVVYRTDVATFGAIVRGELAPQEAFFNRRIAIEGDMEKALKLAVLFGRFVREFPYQIPERREALDGTALLR